VGFFNKIDNCAIVVVFDKLFERTDREIILHEHFESWYVGLCDG